MPRLSLNEVCTWDFTLGEDRTSVDNLKKMLRELAKEWGFQTEEGKLNGYKHYQGRVSLKIKTRSPPMLAEGIHWSPTSKANMGNMFYVFKEDTRIAGPWTSEDKEIYIPRQFRDIVLLPFQQEILDSRLIFEPRKINFIYDPKGNKGKSTVASIAEISYGGIDLPPINDAKELMQVMACICMDTNNRSPSIVFCDMPRAMDKERLCGIYTALEQIKKGKLYDTRYHYKAFWIDSPQIWVFSNIKPNLEWLSGDRWRFYTIMNNSLVLSSTNPRKRIIGNNNIIEDVE